jgi:citrate lyase beta subunit
MRLSRRISKVSTYSLYPYFGGDRKVGMVLMVDILKAARVVFSFEHHDKRGTGAYELDGAMIDAPVYKQVCPLSSRFDRIKERKADDRL